MEEAVRAEGLRKVFGPVTAVESVDLSVRPGEMFGLVGPDGAGKTTTLRMLAGVLRPTAGQAWVNGVSVARNPERVKHDVAYMSQRFGLYTDLTVIENLHFYADMYRVSRAERAGRLERLFAFSNLGPFQHRLAGKLSGGMKQKLGLSCALIHQPEVLLLDEPTFGVDPISRRDLWLIVHEMVAQGVTAVVSTSYMDEAERFDRVALIHRGRLLALDTPTALQHGLAGDVLELRSDRPRDALALVRQDPHVRRAAMFGDRLHVTVDSATVDSPALEARLRGAGFDIGEPRAIPPSLEDVFIEHIARAEAT